MKNCKENSPYETSDRTVILELMCIPSTGFILADKPLLKFFCGRILKSFYPGCNDVRDILGYIPVSELYSHRSHSGIYFLIGKLVHIIHSLRQQEHFLKCMYSYWVMFRLYLGGSQIRMQYRLSEQYQHQRCLTNDRHRHM